MSREGLIAIAADLDFDIVRLGARLRAIQEQVSALAPAVTLAETRRRSGLAEVRYQVRVAEGNLERARERLIEIAAELEQVGAEP